MGQPLGVVVGYLDAYLGIADFPDYAEAVNGLQVENRGRVSGLVAAVDASQQTIEAISAPETLLLVHHGLFWGGARAVTGRHYRRVSGLLLRDAALYSAHLPLDAHPEVGNNALLAARLGLDNLQPFGQFKTRMVGLQGLVPAALANRTALQRQVAAQVGVPPEQVKLIPGGSERVTRVAIITGGGGNTIAEARTAGCDALVTGEGAAHTYFDATEYGINVLYAGHYATETFGVQALAEHLSRRFDLPWAFHDHPTGM
jgi:dinuclear metal center YbgI/SA1388 family protein